MSQTASDSPASVYLLSGPVTKMGRFHIFWTKNGIFCFRDKVHTKKADWLLLVQCSLWVAHCWSQWVHLLNGKVENITQLILLRHILNTVLGSNSVPDSFVRHWRHCSILKVEKTICTHVTSSASFESRGKRNKVPQQFKSGLYNRSNCHEGYGYKKLATRTDSAEWTSTYLNKHIAPESTSLQEQSWSTVCHKRNEWGRISTFEKRNDLLQID